MDRGELWGDAGEIPQWRVQWDELTKGDRLHVVLEIVIADPENGTLVGKAFRCSTMVRIVGNHKGSPNDEQFHSVTILNEYYEGVNGMHQICVKDDSKFLGHWAIDKTSLMTAVESCAGLGIGAIRLQRAGFDVVAANDISKPLMEAYAKLHPGVEAVVGDIRHEPTLVALHDAAPTAAVLAAGFSCQPFSSGGLKRGSGDDRSCSLPGILRAGTNTCHAGTLNACCDCERGQCRYQPVCQVPFGDVLPAVWLWNV